MTSRRTGLREQKIDRTVGQRTIESPLGTIIVEATPMGVCRVCFADEWNGGRPPKPDPLVPRAHPSEPQAEHAGADMADRAAAQLLEYFNDDRRAFDVPLDLSGAGGTEFQKRVWEAVRGIAFGRTASYRTIAARIAKPAGASRAVGLANGANPLPILVPCHRVVGATGLLTGYAGGLARKSWLLEFESADERLPLGG
ncbi:MAG: methylated-DNA--[protein]-cysteine S-methyltransferase [Phycisphaerales bacterium]